MYGALGKKTTQQQNRIKNINGTFNLTSAINEGFKFNFSFQE